MKQILAILLVLVLLGTIPLSQATTYQLPLEQYRAGKDVNCNINLYILFKVEDSSPVCVSINTAEILIKRGWGSWLNLYEAFHGENTIKGTIPIDGTNFVSNYTITNANLTDIKQDKNSMSMILSINSHSDGTVAITIPRSFFDSAKSHPGFSIYILNDGQENTDFHEIDSKTNMTFVISFIDPTKEIEIIGSYYA